MAASLSGERRKAGLAAVQLRNVVPKKGCGAIGVIVFNDGFDCGQARCAVKRELRALFEIGNGELYFVRRVVCENLQGNGMQKCAFAGVYICVTSAYGFSSVNASVTG